MHIFISYCQDNKAQVEPIEAQLQGWGHKVWRDPHLLAGVDWRNTIELQIRDCDVFLAMMTPEWMNSGGCQWELGLEQRYKRPILYLLLAPVTHIPDSISQYQYVDFIQNPISDAISKLRDGLDEITKSQVKSLQIIGQSNVRELRILRILEEHRNTIYGLAFSKDSTLLASGSYQEGLVIVWHVPTGTVWHKGEHKFHVWCMAFKPDADPPILVSGSEDRTIIQWDVNARASLRVLNQHRRPALALAFSPDGRTLAAGLSEGGIYWWDFKNRPQGTLGNYKEGVTSLAFSPDSNRVISGCKDGTIRIWDMRTLQEIHKQGHSAEVKAISLSRSGEMLATASSDHTVCLWDIGKSEIRKRNVWNLGEENTAALAFSHDETLLALGITQTDLIRLVPIEGGEPASIVTGGGQGIYSLVFSPDGKWMAAGDFHGRIFLWGIEESR